MSNPLQPSADSSNTSAQKEEAPRFDKIEDAIEAIKKGEIVILADDEDRENEGDLVCAAELVTPQAINFMAKNGGGLICLALHETIVDQLRLPPMVANNTSRFGTNFTVSVEAKEGITTGISAADRAHTIKTVVSPTAAPDDLSSPGHVFPLRARPGGVLERAGQTEGSVDLANLAGLRGAGVMCEIMDEDGTMARYPRLRQIADIHGLKYITIADLIAYRRRTEVQVEHEAECKMPTQYGEFNMVGYRNLYNSEEHYVALILGEWEKDEAIPVRVHSQCLTGDVFGSLRCDCGLQLAAAMRTIHEVGKGVLLYLNQEGRGIGLLNKIHAYKLQEQGEDTVDANKKLGFAEDLREYGVGAQVLHDIGVRKMRLLTNNPRKIVGLEGHGLEVVERLPLEIPSSAHNREYLRTKKERLGHILKLDA